MGGVTLTGEGEGKDSRSAARYEFGDFVLNLRRGELTKNELPVSVRPKTFEVLHRLVANHGKLVTREQLLREVWSDVCVTNDSVSQCIIEIRKALEDHSRKIVRTVPGRGYIFDASINVAEVNDYPSDLVSEAFDNRAISQPWTTDVKPVVAVLPFACHSKLHEDLYFADGMHDELISRLTQNGNLRVSSRTSAMLYRKSDLSIPDIGKQLSATLLLEGSIHRSGEYVRTTVHLVDAHDDQILWGQIFDRKLTPENRLTIQGEIAIKVLNQLFPVNDQ